MRFLVVALSVAVVTSAFGAGSEGFKDWENSPQGYFMTRAEHVEWSALKTPEEQQHFVDRFLAKRGPEFPAMVASRAAQADKHLTVGKLAGSRTLRGKLVILFGPPSGMDTSRDLDISGVHRDNPYVADAYTGGGTGGGGIQGGSFDKNEAGMSMGAAALLINYHFTYASTVAGPFDVTITVDPNTGADRSHDRENSKKLDAAFEAAAQTSIKTK
ncbi:MAG TPA: GWxTD domain-containing protein [Thermoanaerobaculia bacterium]|nr:GWxTD domain-containing protein [Thermoanaerobaculia bacterium]